MNRSFLAIGFAGLLAFSIVGCGVSDDDPAVGDAVVAAETEVATTQTISYGGVSMEVPATWTVADADDGKYVYPEYGGMVYLHVTDLDLGEASFDEAYAGVVAGMNDSGQFTVSDNVEKSAIGDTPVFRTGVAVQLNDAHLTGDMELVFIGGKMCSVMFVIPDEVYDEHSADISLVLNSIEFDESIAPVIENEPEPEPEPEPSKYEYAYVKRGPQYDLYYLIDLDEMTATYFGTNESDSMVEPCSGDLENGLTIDYGDYGFQEHLQYKVPGDDSVVILIDGNGFEWEFTKVDVAEAEAVLASVS
ncbi:MAG: hypothetical protein IJH04_02030 [Eggerthellaceae bacterium]|nr:hypothetical protein [Eggerthellaceae bacterium]